MKPNHRSDELSTGIIPAKHQCLVHPAPGPSWRFRRRSLPAALGYVETLRSRGVTIVTEPSSCLRRAFCDPFGNLIELAEVLS